MARKYRTDADGTIRYKTALIKPASSIYWEVTMEVEGRKINETVPFLEGAFDMVDNIVSLANA